MPFVKKPPRPDRSRKKKEPVWISPVRRVERAARRLLGLGWCPAFQDNALRPEAALTRGELAMMAFGWETVRRRVELVRSGRAPFRDMGPRDPYAAAAALAVETGAMAAPGGRFRPGAPVSPVFQATP